MRAEDLPERTIVYCLKTTARRASSTRTVQVISLDYYVYCSPLPQQSQRESFLSIKGLAIIWKDQIGKFAECAGDLSCVQIACAAVFVSLNNSSIVSFCCFTKISRLELRLKFKVRGREIGRARQTFQSGGKKGLLLWNERTLSAIVKTGAALHHHHHHQQQQQLLTITGVYLTKQN